MTRTLSGRHVLGWLIGSFGVVFAINVLFIVKAIATYPGEDVHNPYLQGIDYNLTLADRAQQKARGWQATISAARSGNTDMTVSVTINGALPGDFGIKGALRHPMDAERDRLLSFQRVGRNTFESRVPSVRAGAWDVVVSATDNVPFEASRRIWLP